MTGIDLDLIGQHQTESCELEGGHVRFSSMIARDLSGDVRAQTRDVLGLVDECLAVRGMDRASVLIVHIWLRDMSLFQGMTAEWNNWIGDLDPPSRSCVSGGPVVPGALLAVDVTAVLPEAPVGKEAIRRFGLVRGPGRPTMCLALGLGDWFTVCTLASDCSAGIAGQTQQILRVFDGFMGDAAIKKTDASKLEVWLKDIDDVDAVSGVLANWFAPAQPPALTVVGANMASPDMLIEIRLTAAI